MNFYLQEVDLKDFAVQVCKFELADLPFQSGIYKGSARFDPFVTSETSKGWIPSKTANYSGSVNSFGCSCTFVFNIF